uniref:Uncharacterized protein n=1 Tax=Rhizophora mucronata TaxID=61149 RepID=A0A2P2KG18_RHIMU
MMFELPLPSFHQTPKLQLLKSKLQLGQIPAAHAHT